MCDRYIKEADVRLAIMDYIGSVADFKAMRDGAQGAMYAIETAPTADVVEVVRCKDCKWWHTGGCAFRSDSIKGLTSADDYCSHGERKELYEKNDY